MRIHLAASLVVIAAAAFFSFSRLEWGILLLTIAMVMVAETVNTAVEAAVDLKSADRHPLAAKAKDTAAGAVLLAALFAVAIGVLLFGPRLYLLLKS